MSIFINWNDGLQLQILTNFSVTLQQSTQTTRPAGPQSPLDTSLGKPTVAVAKPSCHAHLQDSPVKSSHLHRLGLQEGLGWPAGAGEVARAPLVMTQYIFLCCFGFKVVLFPHLGIIFVEIFS